MTVLTATPEVLDAKAQPEVSERVDFPKWYKDKCIEYGERLIVAEWEDERYRSKHGWKGKDLIHSSHAPVRILDYRATYGEGVDGFDRGGVGTTLTGLVHFTELAESHKGFCHGGSMCSVMDDIIGWTAFLVTGQCRPWTGFTVQVNTSLKRPIIVNSYLLMRAIIVKIERRKVSVEAKIVEVLGGEEVIHATAEGLVVLNRGVLPDETK